MHLTTCFLQLVTVIRWNSSNQFEEKERGREMASNELIWMRSGNWKIPAQNLLSYSLPISWPTEIVFAFKNAWRFEHKNRRRTHSGWFQGLISMSDSFSAWSKTLVYFPGSKLYQGSRYRRRHVRKFMFSDLCHQISCPDFSLSVLIRFRWGFF